MKNVRRAVTLARPDYTGATYPGRTGINTANSPEAPREPIPQSSSKSPGVMRLISPSIGDRHSSLRPIPNHLYRTTYKLGVIWASRCRDNR